MDKNTRAKNPRYPFFSMSPYTTNVIHLRNPWVTAWWAAAFPGFGHILLGNYIIGFVLIGWEILVNFHANINTGILYSLTGRFDSAKEVLDRRELLIYIAVYVFSIWDSWRRTADYNKLCFLSEKEFPPVALVSMNPAEINCLDKKSPWTCALWSLLMPGLGHLYIHRLATGFLILILWIAATCHSHLLEAVHHTFTGNFSAAAAVADPEWLLFMPSIYGFSVYCAYVYAVEFNKVFDREQARFLKENYQEPGFPMPL
ncbi:MAG TPA: hypothetical protein PK728_01000 [Bacillota bacterium]|nr:hypothetical protein [Bacillota bacterium]